MTLGSHQATVGKSQTWITPKWIIDKLGPFDLDPCEAQIQPWKCAAVGYTVESNGLAREWNGRVFLNPPFDRYQVGKWIAKLAIHGNGIALLHARTEAEWFLPCWQRATAILFLADRLYFHYPDGRRAEANSGAPACLVAFGNSNVECLVNSKIKGALVWVWENQ